MNDGEKGRSIGCDGRKGDVEDDTAALTLAMPAGMAAWMAHIKREIAAPMAVTAAGAGLSHSLAD